MTPELDKQLCEKYSKIFRDRHAPMTQTAMCWGFECGDGWYNIINTLCFQIQSHLDWKTEYRENLLKHNPHNHSIPDEVSQVVAEQVKEKYGTLRFYVHGGDDYTHGLIQMACAMTDVTCEQCGAPGKMRGHGWYYTACDKHTREEDLYETEINSAP